MLIEGTQRKNPGPDRVKWVFLLRDALQHFLGHCTLGISSQGLDLEGNSSKTHKPSAWVFYTPVGQEMWDVPLHSCVTDLGFSITFDHVSLGWSWCTLNLPLLCDGRDTHMRVLFLILAMHVPLPTNNMSSVDLLTFALLSIGMWVRSFYSILQQQPEPEKKSLLKQF